jgi:hypothetical protein
MIEETVLLKVSMNDMKARLEPYSTITCVEKGAQNVHCIMVTARQSQPNYIYDGMTGCENSTPHKQFSWLLGCIDTDWHHVTTVHESDGVVTTTCSMLGPKSESKGLMWLNLLTYKDATITFTRTNKGWNVRVDGYETHFDSVGNPSTLPATIMGTLGNEMCYGHKGYWNHKQIVDQPHLKIFLITGRFTE